MTISISTDLDGPGQPVSAPRQRGLAARIRDWYASTQPHANDGGMMLDGVSARDWVRIALAGVLCAILFLSDLVTPVEMNEVQLYPLALLPLYRVQVRYLMPLFTMVTVALIVLGYSIAPDPDFWDGLSNRTFSILMVLVISVALARLASAERKLMLRALTDPLTGVFNRRTFIDLSSKEEARARRTGTLTSVLMMDIDHFKNINDSYGHPVGDLVIKALAETATKGLRPTDILARYGGEEFVVTLPQTDVEVASRVAERLRAALEQATVSTDDGKQVRFTVSIGIATFTTGVTLAEAIESADQALYRAKQGGRNRVENADLLEPEPVAVAAQPA